MDLDYGFAAEIAGKYDSDYAADESIARYTSFGIGGRCGIIVKPSCVECIAELVRSCRERSVPYYIFGRCSNVLITDKGLDAVIILISSAFSGIRRVGDSLICEAGAPLSKICVTAREEGLTGMEFAYGIPGTIGGGLYMNAGTYGGELKDVVTYCKCIDKEGNIIRVDAADMELSYRNSRFMRSGEIILEAGIKLSKGNKDEISEKMDSLMAKRKEKQPLEYPSAGSTFKRPEGYFAAKLIEAGGAQVSEKHSGFVINRNNASFSDVKQVVEKVKEIVFAKTGIMLECEMLIIE